MLSRASSDAGTRLRRSKSTSTVHRHPPPTPERLDPDVAQQHALAAATTAYVRAHAHEAAERPRNRGSDLSRSKSNASRKSQGSHFPPRESSLRSIQPQKGAQMPSVSRQIRTLTMATEKFPPFQSTPGANQNVMSQPSITFNENTRPSSQPKSNRPSASSSVASQQIRKARSMYYASSIQTGSPLPRPPAKYLTTPPPVSPVVPPEGLITPVRLSAVSPLASPRLPVTIAPDESVDKARDKYLQDFRQPRQVRHKPSLFLAPFKKRQEKGKNRVPSRSSGFVSNDSSHTATDTTVDVTLSDFQPQKEKRSFSNSLKTKFKKVFRKTSNKSSALPVQQVEASRDYFGDYAAHSRITDRNFEIPSPDEDALQRIRSRTPSLEGGRPALIRQSSRGSLRSLHSDTDISNAATSRVTSWSNSSASNTLTQREIKRLTVIHEAKDSIGSEADRNPIPPSPTRKPPSIPAFAAFREPMPMESVIEEVSTPVDPKRVFSALMKEIDASKATSAQAAHLAQISDQDGDVFAVNSGRDIPSSASREVHSSASRDFPSSTSKDPYRPLAGTRPESVATQSKASSIKSFGRALRSTIRTVSPSEHTSSPIPARPSSVRGHVRHPHLDTDESSTNTGSDMQRYGGEDNVIRTTQFKKRPRNPLHPRETVPEKVVTPTPEQIESRVEKSKGRWKTPLEENHIPFFPRSTKRTFTVTNIARKTFSHRPSQDQAPAQALAQMESLPVVEETRRADAPHSPKSPKPRPLFSPLSPSIYSRNTDGASILPNDSALSLDKVDMEQGEGGTAVIITSHPVKSFVIGTPSPHRRTNSNRSSRDWKAWLSHEVSELENLPQEDFSIHKGYTSTNHTREFTQVSEDDTTVIRASIEVSTPKQLSPEATPTNHDVPREPYSSIGTSPESLAAPKKSEDSRTPRKNSPRPPLNSLPKKNRQSSILSDHSSLERPKLETRASERMNERFPYIKTGRRRSSNNSGRYSYKSQSTPNSGSSSLKASPSPRVYSDFSAPSVQVTPKHEPNSSSKRAESTADNEIENRKENAAPSSVKSLSTSNVTSSSVRPKSLQPLASSAWNRSPSSLAIYTTSAEDPKVKLTRNSSPAALVPTRPRLRPQNTSISKLAARPKSAFDLRGATTPSPLSTIPPASDSPKKASGRQSLPIIPRKPVAGRPLEGDALRMILESPDLRGDVTGRVTPGQRMAERFLRERHAGSGAGTPVSVISAEDEVERERDGFTPAFL
ncbi:uncharacterized protein BDR25DRAFT_296929 [Lindgomyces ingoldianus]|uniref:Uncharacterized protein n=1 Tax=Lindgomyces ingoldianus TaxID=673940 RepID=A0ACB6QBQ9_9PLEO|nr:uncharacterized protein BDR25DRAFT_296929 [Lindgomyces ingoldianus]KAF2464295.1 hypothetical protein BDR25DRAFT_296929 [Lindgomyces ingoldianus]